MTSVGSSGGSHKRAASPANSSRVLSPSSSGSQQDKKPGVGALVFGASALPPSGVSGSSSSGRVLLKSESVASESSDATGWGFFEECDFKESDSSHRLDATRLQNRETPEYVLEDTLSFQALWHRTAGTRPVQPPAERRRFELMWEQNFKESKVDYDALTAQPSLKAKLLRRLTASFQSISNLANVSSTSHSSGNSMALAANNSEVSEGEGGRRRSGDVIAQSGSSGSKENHNSYILGDGNGVARKQHQQHPQQLFSVATSSVRAGRAELLLREQSPFGTSVTKSWQCECCGELTSIMIRIPKFQIVRTGDRDVHAEYLVVCRLGAVTFGLWRRYSHFQDLAEAIATKEHAVDYQNTLWSWRCLRRRQRWFRCLDKDYLALKCFLLERFLHDAVFESSSSTLFVDFLELKL